MNKWIARVAGWSAGRPLPALVVVFVSLLWLISFSPFRFSEASISEAYGTGTLDLQLGADAGQAAATLDRLGEAGRHAYDQFQIVDLFFPASYALALGGLIWRTWQGGSRRWVALLAAVPMVGAALDYLENALVRAALWTFPDTSQGLLSVSTTVTTTKLLVSYVSQGLVLVGLLLLVVRTVRHRLMARG